MSAAWALGLGVAGGVVALVGALGVVLRRLRDRRLAQALQRVARTRWE